MSVCATCGTAPYCADDECGSDTPACPHDHMVRPEQSNPSLGLSPPYLYGTPITDRAAATALPAPELGGGGGGGGVGFGDGVGPPGSGEGAGGERIRWTACVDSSFASCSTSACWPALGP